VGKFLCRKELSSSFEEQILHRQTGSKTVKKKAIFCRFMQDKRISYLHGHGVTNSVAIITKRSESAVLLR
jgi:hypothetical protein